MREYSDVPPDVAAGSIGLVVLLPIGLMLGAALLRVSVALANRVAAAPAPGYECVREPDDDRPRWRETRPIPEPALVRGMAIVFATGMVNLVAGPVVGYGVSALGTLPGLDPRATDLAAMVAAVPVALFVNAALLALVLPTSLPRGCLVTLFQNLIVGGLAAVFVGGVLLLGLVISAGKPPTPAVRIHHP